MGENPQKPPQHYSKKKLHPTYKPTNKSKKIKKINNYIQKFNELKLNKDVKSLSHSYEKRNVIFHTRA